MSEQTIEPGETDPHEAPQERWSDLAPEVTPADEVPEEPDEQTGPGSLGGDNGGA
jgi:hypothetical protein